MKDVLVYLSGPITPKNGHTIEENFLNGFNAFLELTRENIPCYLPHFIAMFPSAHLIPYQVWMEYDYAVIRRCTHVLMLPRWEESSGALDEKNYADLRGIPIATSLHQLLSLIGA